MTEGGRKDLVEQIAEILKATRPEKRASAIADWMLAPGLYHHGGGGGRAWAVVTSEENIRIQDLRPNKLSAQEHKSLLDRLRPRRDGETPRRVIAVQFIPYDPYPYAKSSGEPRGAQAAGAVSAASCSAGTASSTTAFQPERQTKGTAGKMETPRPAVHSTPHKNPGRGRGRPRLDRPGRLSSGGGSHGTTPRDR